MSMNPVRKKEINSHLIEEYYWHGDCPVYIDNRLVGISFDQACKRVENEQANAADEDKFCNCSNPSYPLGPCSNCGGICPV